MKHIVPNYYTDFRCIAGACRHNCCIGWEIDIDSDTVAFYSSVRGTIGERLAAHIAHADGQAYFRLTHDERCPFLNGNGLCDLIIALGENALCQICADHPRFRNPFSDRIEIGLGLCCEAAAARILRQAEPVYLRVLADDGCKDTPTPEEQALFERRDALFAIAQNRTLSVEQREEQLLQAANATHPPLTPRQFAALYMPLERLDEAWTAQLLKLSDTMQAAPLTAPPAAFEQLLVYFLYRHLSGALESGDCDARIAFAVHAVRLLRLLCAANDGSLETLIELARLYSAEIEYSDENVDRLLSSF